VVGDPVLGELYVRIFSERSPEPIMVLRCESRSACVCPRRARRPFGGFARPWRGSCAGWLPLACYGDAGRDVFETDGAADLVTFFRPVRGPTDVLDHIGGLIWISFFRLGQHGHLAADVWIRPGLRLGHPLDAMPTAFIATPPRRFPLMLKMISRRPPFSED